MLGCGILHLERRSVTEYWASGSEADGQGGSNGEHDGLDPGDLENLS